jgi:single-stranded DNA-binding protein
MLNQYVLQGRLCSLPKERLDIDGRDYVTFDLAIPRNRRYMGVLYTDFIQCRAKGRVAELVLSSVQPGQEIIVQGSLRSRCQKRADGSRLRSEQYLHVEHVFFSRPKTTAETDAERSTEEAIEVPESADGIDESGFFPENEVLEDTTNE